MRIWAGLRKVFLLLAVIVMLFTAWPTKYLPVRPLPPLKILKPEDVPGLLAPSDSATALPELEYEENYYDIKVNDVLMEQSILTLKDKNGTLWLPVKTLESMNFVIPDAKQIDYVGEKYISMNSIQGVTHTVDMTTLTLNLATPITAFKSNKLDFGGSKIVDPTEPPWGGFLNYNILATNLSNVTNANALVGVTVFGPYGFGTSSFSYTTTKAERPWVRLLTTWIVDNPNKMTTLAIGDDVSTGTNWSGSLNYGGIQYARNFGTQPAFYTFPLPGYKGAAIVPSTINMFVNSVMVKEENVAPGVFDITNIPMTDGQGNVVIVTRDILGRRQVYKANYYISTTLLKKGLSNYSFDAGLIREDLGIRSNVYSQFIGAITYGYGLSDSTTAQVHGEVLSYEQALGFTVTQLLGQLGVATGSIAGSQSLDLGKGALGQLTYQYLGQAFSAGGSGTFTTDHFTQSGQGQETLAPKWVSQVFASFALGDGSLSANWTKQINRESDNTSFITASYSTNFFNAISMVFTMIRTLSGPPNRSAFLGLSYSFDTVTSLNGTFNDTIESNQKSLQLIRQLPVGPGYGYDITLNEGARDAKDGSLSYRNDYGTYILQAQKSEGESGSSTYSLNVSGGMLYMDKHFKLSRDITNSFGFVKTFGIKDIAIYSQNQLIGITDESGITFVPNLLPYQETVVNVDPNTVPLDVQIDSFTKTVIPYRNSGVLIPFQMKEINNVTVTLKLADGKVAPEGSVVKIKDNEQEFIVGLEGSLYLGGVSGRIEAQVIWTNASCTFSLDVPKAQKDNPIPDLGTITCKESALPDIKPEKPAETSTNPVTAGQPQNPAPAVTTGPPVIDNLPAKTNEPAVTSQARPRSNDAFVLLQAKLNEGINQAIQQAVLTATKPVALKRPFATRPPIAQNIVNSIMQISNEGKNHAIYEAIQHATS